MQCVREIFYVLVFILMQSKQGKANVVLSLKKDKKYRELWNHSLPGISYSVAKRI